MQAGVDRHRHLPARQGRHRRTRAVGGQIEDVRGTRHGRPPEIQLGVHQRGRIAFAPQHVSLPQRVIGVLDRERFPGRFRAGDAGGVRRHHIAGERRHGLAVTGDVMDHEDEQETPVGPLPVVVCVAVVRAMGIVHAVRVDRDHGHTHRHRRGHVEAAAYEYSDDVRDLGGRCSHRLQKHRGVVEDELPRLAVGVGVDRPQHLVPPDHVVEGPPECREVQVPCEFEDHRDVVGRRLRLHPIEEPHPLLRQRQRDALRANGCRQRGAPVVAQRPDQLRQCRDAGRVEHRPQRNPYSQLRTQPRRHHRGGQRVATQGEEVIVGAHARHAEDVLEDMRHGGLGRAGRCAEPTRGDHRFGQATPIQLAGRREGYLVQYDHRGRDHVRGQRSLQRRT